MGILDTLFGRRKPVPVAPERLFAISTAQITLEAEQSLKPACVAAMCFKNIASGPFTKLQQDLDAMLRLSDEHDTTTATKYRPFKDDLGYAWLIFESTDFQSLVTTIHVASRSLLDGG